MKGDLSRSRTITRTAGCIALMAAGSWISLPIGPVPVSLQTLMVMLTGILMKRTAWLPMTLYVVLGACGLPVFHNGIAGPGVLLGPTGGYIIGFVVAGTLIGLAYERKERAVRICGLFAGEAVIYAAGILWLGFSTGMTFVAAFIVGFLPFIPGDMVKGTVAYFLGERLEKSNRLEGSDIH